MVKGWDGIMGGSKFESQCGQQKLKKKNICQLKKKQDPFKQGSVFLKELPVIDKPCNVSIICCI